MTRTVEARRLPDMAAPGVADARQLPDEEFAGAWSAIVLPEGTKSRLVRTAVASAQLRAAVPFDALPLHGGHRLVRAAGRREDHRGAGPRGQGVAHGGGSNPVGVHRSRPARLGQFVHLSTGRNAGIHPTDSSTDSSTGDAP